MVPTSEIAMLIQTDILSVWPCILAAGCPNSIASKQKGRCGSSYLWAEALGLCWGREGTWPCVGHSGVVWGGPSTNGGHRDS